MEHLFIVPYRLFSCNLLFDVGHDDFDCLLQQNDIQPVTDFYPPARCGLDFGFQRISEVLHLRFPSFWTSSRSMDLMAASASSLAKVYMSMKK